MNKETQPIGLFDARPGRTPSREQWALSLTEQLRSRDALYIVDARTKPLPEFLQDRLTKPDIEAFDQYLQTTFGSDWKNHMKGKTFVIAYTKFGHGHKHQALDMATTLAQVADARVVLFDPMDALPVRERMLMVHKKDLHKAMQFRDQEILNKLKTEIENHKNSPWWQSFHDFIPYEEAYLLGEIAMKNLPAQSETGNNYAVQHPSRLTQLSQKILTAHPIFFGRAFSIAETEATERSVAAATSAIAAQYGADAILATQIDSIRAMTPDVLLWLPNNLHKAARHALQTIITITPDNGYTKRKPGTTDNGPLTKSEIIEDIAIASPHAFTLRNTASWLRRAVHVVADDVVAERFSSYWGVPKREYFPFGTVADTISPQQYIEKWSGPTRRILIASNGNGSNIPDAVRAIQEMGALSPTWLQDHQLHLDVFIADLPTKVPMILEAAQQAGMQDQIEIIDYTKDFFEKQRSFSYSSDPKKRIHVAFGVGDAAGSDLKQFMQRAAHVEIRSPGENALTGAKVGTLELCTPPGGPNEVYNMAWSAGEKLAYPINWTSDTKALTWETMGFTESEIVTDGSMTHSFPDMMKYLLRDNRMETMARDAYRRVNKQTNYAIIGLLTGEIFRRNNLPTPDRETLKRSLSLYMHKRNAVLDEELTMATQSQPHVVYSHDSPSYRLFGDPPTRRDT